MRSWTVFASTRCEMKCYASRSRLAQRFRLARGLAGVAVTASDHNLRLALVASFTAVLTCRLTCAVARPRIEPAMLFAPLSHMLKNGFFFNHGLRTRCFLTVETSSRQFAVQAVGPETANSPRSGM